MILQRVHLPCVIMQPCSPVLALLTALQLIFLSGQAFMYSLSFCLSSTSCLFCSKNYTVTMFLEQSFTTFPDLDSKLSAFSWRVYKSNRLAQEGWLSIVCVMKKKLNEPTLHVLLVVLMGCDQPGYLPLGQLNINISISASVSLASAFHNVSLYGKRTNVFYITEYIESYGCWHWNQRRCKTCKKKSFAMLCLHVPCP